MSCLFIFVTFGSFQIPRQEYPFLFVLGTDYFGIGKHSADTDQAHQ